MSEKLYPHLLEIEETANSRLEQMMPQLAESAGVTKELKARDPMRWVGLMNTCKATGRGDSDGGAYQQLTLNLFLSEAEQIQRIDEAENVKTSSAFSFTRNSRSRKLPTRRQRRQRPTLRELHEKYKPIVLEAVSQDIRYRNACGHSDYENAMIECNAAVRRAILDSHDIELIRLFSDVPEFASGCTGKWQTKPIPSSMNCCAHFRTMTLTVLSKPGMARSKANTPLSAT